MSPCVADIGDHALECQHSDAIRNQAEAQQREISPNCEVADALPEVCCKSQNRP
jgi:hypothetical protein